MSILGIVVAAGVGERFGRPKADVDLHGRPLWRWASDALAAGGCNRVVVVGDVVGGIVGGRRRRDSVAAGLNDLSADTRVVVVHDAARPLASPQLVARVIVALGETGADGVVPTLVIRDTVKQVREGTIVRTVDRSDLVIVQTPQAFDAAALRAAHRFDDEDASDDAAMIERSGGRVAVVRGEEQNLKITYPGDLAVVTALSS